MVSVSYIQTIQQLIIACFEQIQCFQINNKLSMQESGEAAIREGQNHTGYLGGEKALKLHTMNKSSWYVMNRKNKITLI